jgi:hypothetical protein
VAAVVVEMLVVVALVVLEQTFLAQHLAAVAPQNQHLLLQQELHTQLQ